MTPVIGGPRTPIYILDMQKNNRALPLVFSCSGCSFAGKLADDLARHLDRTGEAEMSCLAGIGAKRPGFLAKLHAREVWVIDGCPIECAREVFEQAGQRASISEHIRLHDHGVKKHQAPNGGINVGSFATEIAGEMEFRS